MFIARAQPKNSWLQRSEMCTLAVALSSNISHLKERDSLYVAQSYKHLTPAGAKISIDENRGAIGEEVI